MTPRVPSEAEVRDQMNRLLGSEHFCASDRLRRFLRFIIEETLAGRKERIKAYTIALEVFGKDASFDPLTNPAIRMEAGKLRSKLEHYYCVSCGPDRVRIDIPKGRYVPTFTYLEPVGLKNRPHSGEHTQGNPISTCDSPHFFVERESYSNVKEGGVSCEPGKEGTGTRLNDVSSSFAWSASGDDAVAFISPAPLYHTAQCTSGSAASFSVLVLPFVNIGQAPQAEPLLQGLVEELIIALTKVPALTVFTARDPLGKVAAVDTPRFIRRCGARLILGGSAQISETTIRMRVSLTDALSNQALWAEKFERQLSASALFAIQDAITAHVVARVGARAGMELPACRGNILRQPHRTADLEAYEAVLHYHHWLSSLVAERFAVAHRSLKAAIQRDPGYGMAFAMLADLYAVDYKWSYNLFTNSLDESLRLAEHALSLNPECQYANWSMAYNHYLRYDRDNFLNFCVKSVQINPSNTNIACTAGFHLCNVGEWETGLQLITRSLELNPFVPNWYVVSLFTKYLLNEDYETAFNEALALNDRGFIGGPMLRAVALSGLGRRAEAEAEASELRRISPAYTTRNPDLTRRIFFDPQITERIVKPLAELGL